MTVRSRRPAREVRTTRRYERPPTVPGTDRHPRAFMAMKARQQEPPRACER
jgi:hypothetical protein